MSANKRTQQGAAMLEFSIASAMFLVIIFIIIQISLSYYAWNNVSEAARGGSRYLIVNAPLGAASGLACPGGAAVTVSCGSGSCPGLMSVIQSKAVFVQSSQVSVQYACSASGNPAGADPGLDVSLKISGVPNPFVFWVVPAEGLSKSQTLPTVQVTRVGESLTTLSPP